MDIRKVKKLIELLEESNIGEIEIKEGEESVRISRNGNQNMMPAQAPMYAAPPVAAPAAPAAAAAPVADSARATSGMSSSLPWWAPSIDLRRPLLLLLPKWDRP